MMPMPTKSTWPYVLFWAMSIVIWAVEHRSSLGPSNSGHGRCYHIKHLCEIDREEGQG